VIRCVPPWKVEETVDVQVQLRQELERDEDEDEEHREAQGLPIPVVDELELVPADSEVVDDHRVPDEVHDPGDRQDDGEGDGLALPRIPRAEHQARRNGVGLEGGASDDDVDDGAVSGPHGYGVEAHRDGLTALAGG